MNYLVTAICAYIIVGYLLAEGAYKAMQKAGRTYRGPAYVVTMLFWPMLFLINAALAIFALRKTKAA